MRTFSTFFSVASATVLLSPAWATGSRPLLSHRAPKVPSRSTEFFPNIAGTGKIATPVGPQNCSLEWFEQPLDHFTWKAPTDVPAGSKQTTYKQRVFVCDQFQKQGGPIWFYTGNEADVTLYLNHTGLMWENAEQFGALLVFAEHRYFGASLPFSPQDSVKHSNYLSAEQALADYARLLLHKKADWNAPDSAVIAFGGSYGGMLASWARIKYPAQFDGAIAGSAPIWAFPFETPAVEPSYYNGIVTDTADSFVPGCKGAMHAGFQAILDLGQTESGRQEVSEGMRLCKPIKTAGDATSLAYWATNAPSYLAMGSYPYPSSYMLNGQGILPAFPIKGMCQGAVGDGSAPKDQRQSLERLADAVGAWFNYTGSLSCYDWDAAPNPETQRDGLLWDYLACTEMVMPQNQSGPPLDMFWPVPWDFASFSQGCQDQWGVTPRSDWAQISFGGRRLQAASNIFFSQGSYDPWRGGGPHANISLDRDLVSYIQVGGHHMDLFFSNPLDTPSVKLVREKELEYIRKWIQQHDARLQEHAEL